MEVGCNSYSLKSYDRGDAFATIRSLGFTAVELWTGHADYLQARESPNTISEEARRAGLDIRAFCIGGLFGLPAEVATKRLDRAFAFARGLGVDLITGIIDRPIVGTVDRMCHDYGVRFAIENHWYTDFARPSDFLRALDEASAAVGVNIDTGHFVFARCDLHTVARQLGPRTFNVHFKTVKREGPIALMLRRLQRRYRMEPDVPGFGDQFAPFVEALVRSGYRGMLAVEHETDRLRLDELALYRTRALELLASGERPAANVPSQTEVIRGH